MKKLMLVTVIALSPALSFAGQRHPDPNMNYPACRSVTPPSFFFNEIKRWTLTQMLIKP
jgi:hypothetical protein